MSDEPGYKVAKDGHVYHKSSTANATTAPTNEATIAAADKTKGLTSAQAEFVTIVDYVWQLGKWDDGSAVKDEYGYTDDEWSSLISDSAVLTALQERGISAKAVNPDSELAAEAGRSKLTPLQLVIANTMLNITDTRSTKKKLQDAGVSPYMYDSWLKDPEFKNYLKQRAEGLLGDIEHEAMLALADGVMSGNIKHIEYYHEITGRYVKQSASNQGGGSTHDLQQIIVRIIEIVTEEIEDPNTAARIADRLKGLVMGNQVAGVLPVGEEIVTPEIAEARVITPEVQALMDKGVGVND